MKALSIRQPWAWLIIHAGKDIENREWPTKFRGRFLVHASKGMTIDEYDDAREFCLYSLPEKIVIPEFNMFNSIRGGIVGEVELVDCVEDHPSGWFFGPYGFLLRDAKPLPFKPFKGSLGFFDVPDTVTEVSFNLDGWTTAKL